MGQGILESFCITIPTSGCTDPLACNFNPAASIDNGSCILPNGCTDAAACNFDPAATCDDGHVFFLMDALMQQPVTLTLLQPVIMDLVFFLMDALMQQPATLILQPLVIMDLVFFKTDAQM